MLAYQRFINTEDIVPLLQRYKPFITHSKMAAGTVACVGSQCPSPQGNTVRTGVYLCALWCTTEKGS